MTPEGRWAVVTGASSGIGAAVADRLACEGFRLVLVGRDPERLKNVAARTGGRAVVADLTDRDGIDLVRGAVDSPSGALDLLVHAAGRGLCAPLLHTGARDVAEVVAVNLLAPIELTRVLLPALTAGRGHVVFVSSVAAVGVAEETVYSASKAGLRGFADALRTESGVGVTTVLPGAVATAFFDRRGRGYGRRFPRPVTPGHVAEAVVRAVRRQRTEVFVPRWLRLPAWVHGLAPGIFARLARRWG